VRFPDSFASRRNVGWQTRPKSAGPEKDNISSALSRWAAFSLLYQEITLIGHLHTLFCRKKFPVNLDREFDL
jgi:hypothetical protein